MGEDDGSPVQAALGVANRTLTTYRPGDDPAAAVPLDTTLPLEVHVEREPAVLKLRASVQLGLWFERKLRSAGASAAAILTLRSTYPIPPPNDNDGVYDGDDGAVFRTLVTSRVVDGVALFRAAPGVAAGARALERPTTDH